MLATLVERNKQRITLASASDGTLRFLAFLAAFLGPQPSSFYLFEELETGIHPTRLSLLLDLIENQVKDRNFQVVATAHSPQLPGRVNDGFILKPLFEAMLKRLGKRDVWVKIHEPNPTGWEEVKQWRQIQQILDDFSEARLFILCVDRDGNEQRKRILNDLENRANERLRYPRSFFVAEHAWQEVEVWALAGIDWKLKSNWTWAAIRGERDSKEHYFEPIPRARGLLDSPGHGREAIGAEAARNYGKVRRNCPEVRNLKERIGRWIAATKGQR